MTVQKRAREIVDRVAPLQEAASAFNKVEHNQLFEPRAQFAAGKFRFTDRQQVIEVSPSSLVSNMAINNERAA
ncbi:MAG: hypothetical protein R2867_16005 [Caldilineaceae bacterium]